MDHTIVHFEIPADDPARATKFYRELFGWEIQKWASEGGPGHRLRIRREGHWPLFTDPYRVLHPDPELLAVDPAVADNPSSISTSRNP